MSISKKEIFLQKVSDIYASNKNSPLFVRQADIELQKGAPDKAAAILKDGLKLYRHHPVAHLLLGKSLAMLGKYSQAIAALQTGCDLIHSNDTYAFYMAQIEQLKKDKPALSEDDSTGEGFDTKKVSQPEEKRSTGAADVTGIEEPAEEELEEIAKSITTEEESIKSQEEAPVDDTITVASETIAKIYVAQKQYDEAANIYRLLKKQNPGRKEYFDEKIVELETRKAMDE